MNVSDETAVTDLTRSEGLDRPASLWGEEILAMAREPRNRAIYADQIRKAGYDVADTSEIMANIYQTQGVR